MAGLPKNINQQLSAIFLACPFFVNHQTLLSVFVDERINKWRKYLPEADSLQNRVSTVIDFLQEERNEKGEAILLLFVEILIERTESTDALYDQLKKACKTLQLYQAQANHIIDREKQKETFQDKLTGICNNETVGKRIFEWYGGPKMGKTTLMKWGQRFCHNQEWPYVCITFDNQTVNRYWNDPLHLIIDLVEKLLSSPQAEFFQEQVEQLRRDHHISSLITYQSLSTSQPSWLPELKSFISEFVRMLQTLTMPEVTPIILFIDQLDDRKGHILSEKEAQLADWIELFLLVPLMKLKQVVVVWGARRKRIWRTMNRHVEKQRLELFTRTHISTQIRTLNVPSSYVEPYTDKIFDMTNGHPYGSTVGVSWVGTNLMPDARPIREIKLIEHIYFEFIVEHIFVNLDDADEIACQWLTVLRQFDVSIIEWIFSESGEHVLSEWDHQKIEQLLDRLETNAFLRHSKYFYGRRLDSDWCYIAQQFLRQREQKKFIKMHQIALAAYQEGLAKPNHSYPIFILNELFHLASLKAVGNIDNDIQLMLQMRLDQYVDWSSDNRSSKQELKNLRDAIEYDQDLKWVAPPEEIAQWTNQITNKAEGLL